MWTTFSMTARIRSPRLHVTVEVDVPGEDVGQGDGDVGALASGLGCVPHARLDRQLNQVDPLLSLDLAPNREVAIAVAANLPFHQEASAVVDQVELLIAKDEAELVARPGLPEVEFSGLEGALHGGDRRFLQAGGVQRLRHRLILGQAPILHDESRLGGLDGGLREQTRQEG